MTPVTYRAVEPGLFDAIVKADQPPAAAYRPRAAAYGRRRMGGTLMLGKLTWPAIPFDQPIPLGVSDRR